jgi:hypothetical protein
MNDDVVTGQCSAKWIGSAVPILLRQEFKALRFRICPLSKLYYAASFKSRWLDDDSSVRKILTHFIKYGRPPDAWRWPKYPNGKEARQRYVASPRNIIFGRQRPSSARLPRFLSRKPPNLPTDVDVKVDGTNEAKTS